MLFLQLRCRGLLLVQKIADAADADVRSWSALKGPSSALVTREAASLTALVVSSSPKGSQVDPVSVRQLDCS
jgi:hypothetical protein